MSLTNDFEKQLAKQPCNICKANRSIKKCPGHALGNDAGEEVGNDDGLLQAKHPNEGTDNKKTSLKTPALRPDTAELKKWLNISYDKESGIFSIKLDDPRFTPEQKNEFVQQLLSAWKEFRNNHGLTHSSYDPHIIKDALGNVTITLLLPNNLFKLFLQFLVNKDLLSQEMAQYHLAQPQNNVGSENRDAYRDSLPLSLQRMMNPFLGPRMKI